MVLLEFAPLAWIASADGCVSKRQRDAILRIAFREHVYDERTATTRLHHWFERRPPDDVFDVSLSALHAKFQCLHWGIQRRFVEDCTAVACAADTVRGDDKIASAEGRVLAQIIVSLKPGRPVR